VTLALFPFGQLAADIGSGWDVAPAKFSGITLGHNVRSRDDVDVVLAQACRAGVDLVKAAAADSCGYSGYFSDPDGYLWEVAWGAFDFNGDGSLHVT
jgi:catechol 2,3-dioxygenase-like lactoylglutathione lyase family enzyme